MYKYFTHSKLIIVAGLLSLGLVLSGNALAAKSGPGKPGNMNIVELALANPEFDRLVEAILCFSPDLENPTANNPVIDLLSGSDKYTVFAPNNEAFDALLGEEGSPCDLDATLLFTVLAYHVTDGRRFANSVFNRNNPKVIEMLAAGSIVSMPDLTLHDIAEQTITLGSLINVNASNGVIHEINSVMLPIPPAPED